MIRAIFKKRPVDIILFFLFLFSCFYIAGNIGTGSLTNWDEAVYANVSREIVRTGDWLKLQNRGQLWLDKPPLYMWMTSIFYRMFGVNEFSSRLTSSIFAILTVCLSYLFLKRIASWQSALLGALVLLGLPHYLHFSKMGMLDPALTFFVFLSLFMFWKGQDDCRYLLYSGIFMGLGYLTKGFASFLTIAIIILYCLLAGQLRLLIKKEFLTGVAACLAMVALWYAAQYLAVGQGSLESYFRDHIFGRMAQAKDEHAGGFNFYQKAIFNKNKPWAVFLFISFLYTVMMSFRKRQRVQLFVLSWVAAAYLIFSAIQTKLHWYILPIYPALSLSFALFAERFLKGRSMRLVFGAIFIGLLLQIPYSWAFKLDFSRDLKDAAYSALTLKSQKADIFVYGEKDEKENFYFAGFPLLNTSLKSESAYCVLNVKYLDGLSKFREVSVWRKFGDYVVVKLL